MLLKCIQAPFLSCEIVLKHPEEDEERYKEEMTEIKRGSYVDDIHLTGNDFAEVQHLKECSEKMFTEATFHLHKLHLNKQDLEKEDFDQMIREQKFPEEQLGVAGSATTLLGLGWNKGKDTIYTNTKPGSIKRN